LPSVTKPSSRKCPTTDLQTHFVTGTAAPCTSLFKPVWLGSELPPTAAYDEASLFWRHEALYRATLRNYAASLPLYAPERDALEAQFVAGALKLHERPAAERGAYAAACFAQAAEAEGRWRERLAAAHLPDTRPFLYALAWRGFERTPRRPAQGSFSA